ncbi:unnamed protein product [Urochloa decumbens]|uniref:F-box domain-containing protein n=1 Tax=Urochloa decumbens TaxID=240449 RepID=A0ABC9DAQ2_9POAL
MEQSAAAKRPKPSSAAAAAGEDRLSALPDDVLVLILLRLDTAAAVRTSALSRRWRRVWALLPELRFPTGADPRLVASALASHEAAISYLGVEALDAAPDALEACLAVAAGRLSGRVIFQNRVSGGNAGGDGKEETGDLGSFELPCFESATTVSLDLGFLGLAMPLAGVFARLTDLSLRSVRFHGPCELGDAVSSLRCPCLQKLSVSKARGLANLSIHSESLIVLSLQALYGLQQLNVGAQALKKLALGCCFTHGRPVANISTTQLVSLQWLDSYDPKSVQLDGLAQVKSLVCTFNVYDSHGSWCNRGSQQLLKRFQALLSLQISLFYPKDIGSFQYAMEELTKLPCLTSLAIMIRRNGHTFGASLFHVLRMCSDIRNLVVLLLDLEEPFMCPSGCVCGHSMDWNTEELTLNFLQEVAIDMEGTDHQVAVVKRLFTWAVVLKRMQITFHPSLSECKVRELHQMLSSFSGPETRVEFYMYHTSGTMKFDRKRYLLGP